jgi:hypothetical protein
MSRKQRLARLAAIAVLTLVFVWLLSSTTATATTRFVACSPVPTPEAMSVEPVTSPTTLLTQTLRVRLGNGRRVTVTVTSEAGTLAFPGTYNSAFLSPLTVPLSRNVTHHVTVIGQVEYQSGCYYTLSRTVDKNNAPLTIIQLGRRVFLPIIRR